MNDFIKRNKVKIIILVVIVVILIGLFLIGRTSGGKDINYIPV